MERAFVYGDLLFETILCDNGRLPHITRHFKRLAKSAQILKLDLGDLNETKIIKLIEAAQVEYDTKNPGYTQHRIRFVLHRKSEGFYLPKKNEVDYLIDVFPFDHKKVKEVSRVGIYNQQQKAPGPLSNLKSGNALLSVMASIWANENGHDDALILNTNNQIVEASSSNIFWLKNGHWFTPPLSDGCVSGIGRELFVEKNLVTEAHCSPNDLQNADECLLTNALISERRFVLIA